MLIGVMGYGATGEATAFALQSAGHETLPYDPPKGLYGDMTKPAIVFVCVPAPTLKDRGVDRSVIAECLGLLPEGTKAVIRSTVLPGTTDILQTVFPRLQLCFVPEFLTERTRFVDAMHPNRVVIGTPDGFPTHLAVEVSELFPEDCPRILTSAKSAELAKYAANTFYATKVAFFNQLFDLCKATGASWEAIMMSVEADPFVANMHTEVMHDGYRGYGGKCLPKDVEALIHFAAAMKEPLTILEEADAYNSMLKKLDS